MANEKIRYVIVVDSKQAIANVKTFQKTSITAGSQIQGAWALAGAAIARTGGLFAGVAAVAAVAKSVKAAMKVIDLSNPNDPIAKEFAKLTSDFDAFNEMILTLSITKERMFRALTEEKDNELVLATTGHAIKDYATLVEKMKKYEMMFPTKG